MPRQEKDADALDFYLDDLSRVSALSREDEHALALVVGEAQRKLRVAVLGHPPSLRRMAAILQRVVAGEVRATDVISDPSAAGRTEEELLEILTTTAEQLTKRLSARCRCADDSTTCACANAAELVAELPFNREIFVDLFEQARAEIAEAEDPGAAARRAEWQAVTRALRGAEANKAKLAEHNLRLVVSLARRYARRGLALDDLIQEGNIGLLRAIDGFDPHRGFRLSTYAAWWIRQAMQHALAEQTRTIRVPRHMTEAASAVNRYVRGFHHVAGREPTTEEIASGLGVSVARVNAAIDLGPDAISLETPLGSDDSLELGDVIADSEGPTPADVLLVKDFAEQTRGALDTLSPEERDVIALRFGIDAPGTHSVEEIAAMRRLGAERVRQIEARALRKLRNAKRTRHLRAYARD